MKKFLCTVMAMLMLCQTFIGSATIATAADENESETPATPTVPTTCAAGCENPDWQPISAVGNLTGLEAGHYHVYLDADVTPPQMLNGNPGTTICLDLNGHNITTNGRSAIVYTDTVFNLMDSSENQTGYICGTRGDNNQSGGTLSVQEGGIFNLYSGTLRFLWDDEGAQVLNTAGVVWIQKGGIMNMYGGTVEGADMSENEQFLHSAAIFVAGEAVEDEGGNITEIKAGQLNVYGGKITAGLLPENGVSSCVRLSSYANITLSGDARIDDIWVAQGNITVDGTFSGDANVHLLSGPFSDGKVIGSAVNNPAITDSASIFCYDGNGWDVLVDGENLILHAVALSTQEAYCQHCKTDVVWKSISHANYTQLEAVGSNHFYLTENLSLRQFEFPSGAHTCLDLNDFGITTDGRSAAVYGGASLNIMDNSEKKTGYFRGTRGSNNQKGGTIMIQEQGELNLYSGTLGFEMDDTGSVLLASAGVVWIAGGGTMNMYGGTVEGADFSTNEAFTAGAAIYISAPNILDAENNVIGKKVGRLNAYGGKITSGVLLEGGIADCVYAEEGAQVLLSGNPHIEEIYAKQDTLILDGTFSGEAWLNLYGAQATYGMVVGEATNSPAITGTLFCINDDGWHILLSESKDTLILEPYTPIIENRYCKHCKTEVPFKAITKGNYVQAKLAGEHHFFLYDADFTFGQILVQNAASTCIDLNGYNIDVVGRAFNVATDSTLNLMDSKGGGKVISTTGINNCGGGLAFIHENGTFNLYDGTLEVVTQYVPGKGIGTGGIVYLSSATMNMYGGTLKGADLVMSEYPHLTMNGHGATVFVNGKSQLNVYDGQIQSGTLPEGGTGECVFIWSTTSRMLLSGAAEVDDIYIYKENDQLTVSGDYTGTAQITYPESIDLTYRQVLGKSDNAAFETGAITCREYAVKVLGDDLVLDYEAAAVIFNSAGTLFSDTLADAIPLSTDGYIMLLQPIDETVSAEKDLYLDLNGYSLSGSITLSSGKTLYCMDRQTDDFTVEDGNGYGKLSATVTGTVTGVPADAPFTTLPKLSGDAGFEGYAYLPILDEEDNTTSFHAVNLKLTAMTLRPETVGVYYKCAFAADEMVAPLVESYGMALSIRDVPTAENLEDHCHLTTLSGFTAGGMDQDATSSLLNNIMKLDNVSLVNTRNANTPVYGRAYILTENGYLFGSHCYRSLRTQVELIDDRWDTLTEAQKTAIQEMGSTYSRVMKYWDIPNILPSEPEEEA